MISYILPTRNRPEVLVRTLDALGALPRHEAEVIVVDNASDVPPRAPVELANGVPVRLLFRSTNEGAAARNHGVQAADPAGEWVVMLDDDSHPLDDGHVRVLAEQPEDVAAVAAEVFLASGGDDPARALRRSCPRESGGLPEVFIGCGVAMRRRAFLDAGGYDPAFNYYVEEYDLAAKLLRAGRRVVLERRFRVLHEKSPGGRDMNLILRRLVRNNAWVAQRYAPAARRRDELREVFARYASIAAKEQALPGYTAGAAEALATLPRQPRTPLPPALFDRFTGLAEARRSLQSAFVESAFRTAALVEAGKGANHVRRALEELGVRIVGDAAGAEAVVIGTLSPGPLLDAWERWVGAGGAGGAGRIVAPWRELVRQGSARAELPAASAAA